MCSRVRINKNGGPLNNITSELLKGNSYIETCQKLGMSLREFHECLDRIREMNPEAYKEIIKK